MNERERLKAAQRERAAAENRKRDLERDFAEHALVTYPRLNKDADECARVARKAELEMRYWEGAIAALLGSLPSDTEVDPVRNERADAQARKLSAEHNFGECAITTYPRPNESADEFAQLASEAELEMRYWQGALDALTGKLPIDIEANDDAD